MDRMTRWLLRWRFRAMLLALILLIVVHPLVREAVTGRVLVDILLTFVFLAAFLVIFPQRHLQVVALVLGLPTLAGAWTGYVLPGLPRLPLLVSFHVCAVLLLGFTVAVILQTVHTEEEVTQDSVYGAFCGYLLVGVVFGHLYSILEALAPGSFHTIPESAAQLRDDSHCLSLLTYFSFVTLTTVGYGDIVPGSGAVRALAVTEAVMGQFYIAVLISELIGKRVSQALSGKGPTPGGSS
jgi:hypothetical protein